MYWCQVLFVDLLATNWLTIVTYVANAQSDIEPSHSRAIGVKPDFLLVSGQGIY